MSAALMMPDLMCLHHVLLLVYRMYLKAQLEAEREKANRLAQDERDKLLVFRLASGNNAPPPTIVVATALAKDDKPSVQLSKPNVKVKKRVKGNGDVKESRKKKKDVDDKSTTTEASEDMKKKTDGPSALGGLVAYGSDEDSDAEKGSDEKRED